MNQFLFFTSFSPLIDLFVITSLLLAREAIGMDNQFLACNPKTCGDTQIITFPFYIQDEQESFCGYPGFNVSCQNGHPIIRLQDNDYIIRSMSYETQTLRLTNFAVYDTRTTCTPPFRNASIPSDRFNIYPNQTELFLLYHCNSSQIDGNSELIKYKVNCSSDNASNSTLLISKDDPLLDNASSICENMIATVVDVQRGGERINEIERMLERGFVLNWVSSNCSLCQGSGGTCGFDNNTYHFRCFCGDRPHASHCNSEMAARRVGLEIGEVVEVAKDLEGELFGRFVRVRVELDVTKPLKRALHIQKEVGDEQTLVRLAYEKNAQIFTILWYHWSH